MQIPQGQIYWNALKFIQFSFSFDRQINIEDETVRLFIFCTKQTAERLPGSLWNSSFRFIVFEMKILFIWTNSEPVSLLSASREPFNQLS